MKVKDIVADGLTVASCCVGAGFLSGKEAQLYYGNVWCVIAFVTVFCALTFVVRAFAAKNNCKDVAALTAACCPKFHAALCGLVTLCCFVCVVAIISGAASCLNGLLLPKFDAVYGLIIGLMGVIVVKKGLRALKILNVVSLVVVALYLILSALEKDHGAFQPLDTPLYASIVYATFSVTMALGLLTKVAQPDRKSNVTATLIAGAALVVLTLSVLLLCDFDLPLPLLHKTDNTALNVLGGAAVILCSVTGVCSNALPIVDSVKDVFDGDVTLCLMVTFALAVALSLVGVDFVMKYGYLLVSCVGVVIVGGCMQIAIKRRQKSI